MISIITPTGDRSFCLKRCAYYISRQTYFKNKARSLEWIISDDGEEEPDFSELHFNVQLRYLKRVKGNNKAKSFTGNVLNCLSQVSEESKAILVFEDDDWYHPEYISMSLWRLQDCQIIGESRTIYYNVQKRCYRVNGNTNRASFCQTVFSSSMLPKVKKYCEVNRGSAFVDARIWNHVRKNSVSYKLFEDRRLCIGIKGMPGRKGIGIGHRPGGSYRSDPKFKKLEQLIGVDDAKFYKGIYV